MGDLFNYAAPGEEEAFNSENAFIDSSCWRNHSSTEQYEVQQIDANLLRLTDGGYEEDVSAYCFYVRRNYKKGEQVSLIVLFYIINMNVLKILACIMIDFNIYIVLNDQFKSHGFKYE